MAIGVLVEALLGGPSMSTTTSTSRGTNGDARKGSGAREWIKNKLKALSQLLGKLADKVLASLLGIIGLIISWILNRAKEVIGWHLSQVGTYHRCWSIDIHIFHDKDKEKVSHLNNHHTVKTAVIPNTKATFSSS